jgi:hypothetical protein
MTTQDIHRVLAEMAAIDPDRATLAEGVFAWLGGDVEAIDLAQVQRFVWLEVPGGFTPSTGDHRDTLEATAELLERMGLARYAEVVRSQVTADIHCAYAQSDDSGLRAFLDAYRRSGIQAPDVDDLAWGELMGPEETRALQTVERALERALDDGRLIPGARGWKSMARRVTEETLRSEHPDLPGQNLRTAITTERISQWLAAAEQRSPRLHSLRSRQANRFLHEIPMPDSTAAHLEPITWFLDYAAPEIMLTQAGYLPTKMVRSACDRFGWHLRWTDRAPRSESELGQLYDLHTLLRRMGAVRRRLNKLRVTARGHEIRADLELLWRQVAAGLSEDAWASAVTEVYALLMIEGEHREAHLDPKATGILVQAGWAAEGHPVTTYQVQASWWTTKRILEVLGGASTTGDWRSRTVRLTPFGESTLLEHIRSRATGPISKM